MTEDSPPEYKSLSHPNLTFNGDLLLPEYSPNPKYCSAFQNSVISEKFQTEKLKKSVRPLYDFTQGQNLTKSAKPLWSEIFSSSVYIHRVLPIGPNDSPQVYKTYNLKYKLQY